MPLLTRGFKCVRCVKMINRLFDRLYFLQDLFSFSENVYGVDTCIFIFKYTISMYYSSVSYLPCTI